MCTDGLANKGLGSLDGESMLFLAAVIMSFFSCLHLETKDDEAFSAAQQFYKDLGDIAVERGYVIAWNFHTRNPLGSCTFY